MSKFYKKDTHAKIRRGQIITTFGPGSLVNLEFGSFIAMGIDSWPKTGPQDNIYEERLQHQLKVKYFRQPASAETYQKGIPYRRFPRWLFCPKCRLLKTYENWVINDTRQYPTTPRCGTCYKALVPMSFLVACKKGHLDDFPWVDWVHREKGNCSLTPTLKYETSLAGAGLSGSIIKCTQCDVKPRSMQGAFAANAFSSRCSGTMPWSKDNKQEACNERKVTVQRGGSNVYFSKIASSITIPPFTDTLFENIKQTEMWSSLVTAEGILDDPAIKDKFLASIATEIGRTFEEVKKCVNNMQQLSEQVETQSFEDFRFDEYQAFHGKFDSSTNNKRDFEVVLGNEGYDYSNYGLQNIFLVKSLREVRTLVGFTRLRPLENDVDFAGEEEGLEASELVSLSDNQDHPASWKPAIEVRGEGIFITLNQEKLEEWSKNKFVVEREAKINENLEQSCKRRKIKFKPINAKYILLHTLSHLLIRQLSFEAGYSGSSLRERIYCDISGGENKMQGILIYTAAGDSDGTLGGLVRQAMPQRFTAVLNSLIKNSRWCANDPLCIESKGQGFESLNLSACYACALLPETSCEEFNKYLDRSLVIGNPDNPEIGYLNIDEI